MSSPADQPPTIWSPPSTAPTGKYHIVKPLKIGGTAAIYLAIMRGENNFSREVVIKRPLPHLVSEPRSRHMFIDEAHIASRLSHPNICQVLDLVARHDELYIVLEYLRGVDLREILKRCIQLGRFVPPEVAVWIAVEVAAGLDYAHDAKAVDGRSLNLVHRDVSPKNIRITFEGSVKVIDFGIARAELRITQTSAGTIKGTLGYMSPEQILGDDIDRRSDIFAFGIVLFQMLTLRNPFDGPTLKERVRKLTQAPIPSVREYNPALDDDIGAIVARCLERGVEDRYGRMEEVQVALDEYLARLQVVSPRQRLIAFLKEIFPSFDELDEDLKVAVSEISQYTGPVDPGVRLRFPDDPPTEPLISPTPVPPSGTTGPATEATHPADPASTVRPPSTTEPLPSATPADRPDISNDPSAAGFAVSSGLAFDEAATRPPREPARQDWSTEGQEDTRPLAETPISSPERAADRGRPWGWMLALAAAVMCVAVIVTVLSWPRKAVLVEPLVENPQEQPEAVKTPANTDTSKKAAPTTKRSVASRKVRKKGRPDKSKVDRDRARLLFQTGVRLKKQGRIDDATFLYELAYAYSGARPDPSIYLNLGLLHNDQGREAKAKACLRGYLQARPSAPQASQVRSLLASYPELPTVPCVARPEVARARKLEARKGAQIQRWVDDTLAGRLR